MTIKFTKHIAYATLHSPLKEYQLDSQEIESRVDPLTGQPGIVRGGRKFWQHQYTTDEKVLAEVAEQTRTGCFFCPDRVSTYTPRYPEEFIPGGRIIVGEATLFPNLFAQKEHSAIAVVSQKHFVALDEFTPELLGNAFKATAVFLKKLHKYKSPRYMEIGFNYLFPAGASIPHPHVQILGGRLPTFLAANLVSSSEKYYLAENSCYWDDLIETEKKTDVRYLARLGNVEWLVPFAPQREDEVHGIVRNKSNFLQFDGDDWQNLAHGITRVFKFYKAKGLSSCNFALYSGPLDEHLDYLWAGVRIVSRSSVQARPLNDVWFSQNILYDGLVTEPPEEIATQVRPYFKSALVP